MTLKELKNYVKTLEEKYNDDTEIVFFTIDTTPYFNDNRDNWGFFNSFLDTNIIEEENEIEILVY